MPRFAAKSTPQELWDKLVIDSMNELIEDNYDNVNEMNKWPDTEVIEHAIKGAYFDNVMEDLSKIVFNFENITFSGKYFGTDLVDWFGPQQIGELTFIGGYAGGDWEQAVAFIIYHDGKDWRGYVPNKGNSYNHISKTAYGSERQEGWELGEADIAELEKDHIPVVTEMKADIAARILVKNIGLKKSQLTTEISEEEEEGDRSIDWFNTGGTRHIFL